MIARRKRGQSPAVRRETDEILRAVADAVTGGLLQASPALKLVLVGSQTGRRPAHLWVVGETASPMEGNLDEDHERLGPVEAESPGPTDRRVHASAPALDRASGVVASIGRAELRDGPVLEALPHRSAEGDILMGRNVQHRA